MTIKQQGGIFGRNPTFNDVTVDGTLTQSSGTTNLVDVEASSIEIDTTIGNSTIAQLALWDNSQSEQAYLRLAHSLGTSKGSHTAITVNDALGGVRFAGSTGTAFYDGASVEGKATQTYTASNGGTKLLFKTTPNTTQTLTEQMSLDQDGTLTVANGNIVIGTSGQGIDFSATGDGSGTSTSELLDDYEEGTFQNTIEGGTTAGTCTYVLRLGRYTKIGDQVHFGIQTVFNTHTGTGDFVVGGLPYTVSSANGGLIANVAVYGTNMTFSNQLGARLIPGTTTAKLLDFSSGSSSLTTLGIKASGGVYISGTYEI